MVTFGTGEARILALLPTLKRLIQDPVGPSVPNPERLANVRLQERAGQRYVIFFTPRSGSSRLTDILLQAGLGEPDECFNPAFLPSMARFFGAHTFPDYVDAILRGRNHGGLFGCQISYLHLLMAFKRPGRLRTMLQPTDWLWLIRQDIVAQAVSAARMVQTGLPHDQGAPAERLAEAEAAFSYDPAAIRRHLLSTFWNEWRTEAFFRRQRISPLRLSYETLAAQSPAQIASGVARFLRRPLPSLPPPAERHRKLGTRKSVEFAARFRQENAALLNVIQSWRAQTLLRLQPDPS